MTKPTNEERREVAAKLRELADAYGNTPAWSRIACGELPAPIDDAMQACGLGRITHAAEVCAHLVDLIEPAPERTCRMEYDHVHCDYVCSACGEWHNTGMYDACDADDRIVFKPYRYCPECGARVEVER